MCKSDKVHPRTVHKVHPRTVHKVHPRTVHKDPEAEFRYSSTFSLTSAFYLRERDPVPIFTGWVGPRVWKSHLHWGSIPDRPACSKSLYHPRCPDNTMLCRQLHANMKYCTTRRDVWDWNFILVDSPSLSKWIWSVSARTFPLSPWHISIYCRYSTRCVFT